MDKTKIHKMWIADQGDGTYTLSLIHIYRRPMQKQFRKENLPRFYSLRSVSYTHLAVSKRQVLPQCLR